MVGLSPVTALEFFNDNDIPFWEMVNDNGITSAANDYGFIKAGEVYVVYLKDGGTTNLNLSAATGEFSVHWFDPRNGGGLQTGSVHQVTGGGVRSLGQAPSAVNEDWAIVVREIDADFDSDGDVDGDDFLAWQGGFGTAAPDGSRVVGDADNDQDVDGDDFLIWQEQFGEMASLVGAAAQAAARRSPCREIHPRCSA